MNRAPLHLSRKFHISIPGALTAAVLSISIRTLVSGLCVPLGILAIKLVNFLLIRKFHLDVSPLTFPAYIFWTFPIANIGAGIALSVVALAIGVRFVMSSSIGNQ